ncbi:MAG: hypothetical protein ACFFBV_16140 [Promethearchaeota archaeon]
MTPIFLPSSSALGHGIHVSHRLGRWALRASGFGRCLTGLLS